MPPLATVGILSIGDMGMGVAKLLIANNYRVVTNVEGRSQDTKARVTKAAIEALPTDISLVSASDYILSIVPPRDAFATAKRISTAFAAQSKPTPLYYLDLNAISPRTVRSIAALFTENTPDILFIDGGIIGGPPKLKSAPDTKSTNVTSVPDSSHAWSLPSIPTSGPVTLSSAPISGEHLASTLNIKHITNQIGSASGLKCCFASSTKGATAIAIQAFTTASRLGVLPELQEQMSTRVPGLFKMAQGMTNVPPKAYRWVREMEEIAQTHAEEGGFEGGNEEGGWGRGIFDAVAEVYRVVAEETVLGQETTERRKRGLTTEDVAECVGEGLARKRKKKD